MGARGEDSRYAPLSTRRGEGTPRVVLPAVDVIGDVHGCLHRLLALVWALGYALRWNAGAGLVDWATHPAGRRLIFAGDLVDRGPHSYGVLASVRALVEARDGGGHLATLGNHDDAVRRYLHGALRPGDLTPDGATLDALDARSPTERLALRDFLDRRPHQLRIARAARSPVGLVVAHAGTDRRDVGHSSAEVAARNVHGGLPRTMVERMATADPGPTSGWSGWVADWAVATSGPVCVAGHIPRPTPLLRGRLALIDTGCVFGGALTAYRWPEGVTVSVPGARG